MADLPDPSETACGRGSWNRASSFRSMVARGRSDTHGGSRRERWQASSRNLGWNRVSAQPRPKVSQRPTWATDELVNQGHYTTCTAYLDQLLEVAHVAKPDEPLEGGWTRAFARARYRNITGGRNHRIHSGVVNGLAPCHNRTGVLRN